MKTSVTLPEESLEALRRLADKTARTMAEVLRRAISTETFLHDATDDGRRSEILIEDRDKKIRQLIVR